MKKQLYIALLFLPSLVMGQRDFTVNASLSDTSIKIGEQIIYTLQVNAVAGKKINSVTWPEFSDTIIGPVEVIKKQNPKKEESFICSWVITSFDSGYHAIPPALVYIDTMAYESNPVLLEVHTVEVDTTKEFKDIKDIIGAAATPTSSSAGISMWWYIGGGAVVLALIAFLLLRKKKKTESIPQAPPLSLQERCLAQLLEIEKQQFWQQGEVKRYYTEVTDVVRNYSFHRFGIRASELTSHQLLHQLKLSGLTESLQHSIKELFSLADMAKFARVKPIAQENELAIEIARRYIYETTPVEPVTATEK